MQACSTREGNRWTWSTRTGSDDKAPKISYYGLKHWTHNHDDCAYSCILHNMPFSMRSHYSVLPRLVFLLIIKLEHPLACPGCLCSRRGGFSLRTHLHYRESIQESELMR